MKKSLITNNSFQAHADRIAGTAEMLKQVQHDIIILLFLICSVCAAPVFADSAAHAAADEAETAVQSAAPKIPDKKTMKEIEKQHKKMLKKARREHKAAEKNAAKAAKRAGKNKAEKLQASDNAPLQTGVQEVRIMQLDECVRYALENHPAVQAALADTEIYKSRIAQAWSNYFPVLSAGLSYSRNDAQSSNIVPPVQRYDMFYAPNLSANMLIFDFGKTKAQADTAKRSWEASKYGLESSINTVVYNVKQSYYNLLFAHQQVKVYEDTVHDFQLHLEQAAAYYKIGTKPKIDVLTAEYNLGKAKLNLIQAKNTLKIAFVQLSNAMGLPEFTNYDAADDISYKSYNITMEEAVNTALETSPELLAAKKAADASEALARASRRAFLPDISGFASYSRGGKKVDTDDGYQIGAQIRYDAVNLLLLKKQADEAKAQHNKDKAEYQNIRQNIYFEVQQAYLNMITAEESINVSKLSMEQAKEQYDSASGRYKSGLGDAVELKDAETTFRNAQLSYYNTLLNYKVSAAGLERLMGVPIDKSEKDLL